MRLSAIIEGSRIRPLAAVGADPDIRGASLDSRRIEPGDVFFLADDPPRNYFRLGFSSIPVDRIEPGIRTLAEIVHDLA